MMPATLSAPPQAWSTTAGVLESGNSASLVALPGTIMFNGGTGAQANGNLMIMSDALELIEKFTRSGPDTIQYEVTVNDPKIFMKPWTVRHVQEIMLDTELIEFVCEENNRFK